MTHSEATAAEIRQSLDHPVLDADGHIVEYWPELDRFLREEGIEGGMQAFMPTANFDGSRTWQSLSSEERLRERSYRSPWWGFPNDARDLATAVSPHLLYERLDELGIDLAVCYPSLGLQLPAQRDERLRRLGCRAYNRYAAHIFEGLSDRLLPVAVVPLGAAARLGAAVRLGAALRAEGVDTIRGAAAARRQRLERGYARRKFAAARIASSLR